MGKKKIYIIRHGETEYNKLGLVQGSGIDASLNEVGRKQARAFYDYFKTILFDKIYTSKLVRTHQSAGHFIDVGISWQQLEGLNEISWGDKEGRIITDEDDKQHFAMMDAWERGDLDWKVPGGESPLDVQARQKIAWKYLMSNEQEDTILVCMHGRAMRILLCFLLDIDLKNMNEFPHKNLGLYLLNYDTESEKYEIELSNFTDHVTHIPAKKKKIKNLITEKDIPS